MITQGKALDIVVVEEHEGLRAVISYWLQDLVPEIGVGSVKNFDDLFRLFQDDRPRIVIVGVAGDQEHPVEYIGHLKRSFPDMAIIALSNYDSPELRKSAMGAGADAYIPKMEAYPKLISHVRDLLAQHPEIDIEERLVEPC